MEVVVRKQKGSELLGGTHILVSTDRGTCQGVEKKRARKGTHSLESAEGTPGRDT